MLCICPFVFLFFFFFNDTATTEIYTLSLHDALPISSSGAWGGPPRRPNNARTFGYFHDRSEEHTSELQSLRHLVCRLLLEKKKKTKKQHKCNASNEQSTLSNHTREQDHYHDGKDHQK